MAGFGTIAPGMDDEDVLLAGLQPAGAPSGVDWSKMNQPFGELKRRPEDEVVIRTRNPLTNITEGDIQRGMNIAMATSGGGLASELPKPTVGARQQFASWVDALTGKPHGTEAAAAAAGPAAGEAGVAAPAATVGGGAEGGAAGLGEAQISAERAAGAHTPLPGLPTNPLKVGDRLYIPGPIGKIRDVAEQYMRDRPTPSYHRLPTEYHALDPEHSRAIAQAFDEMKHEPDNPAVKASYEAMIKETRDQYRAIRQNHPELQFVANAPGEDPYAATPRLAARDVAENNRLHFFPTEQGYGTSEQGGIDMSTHPMLQPSGETLNGKPLLNNDLFRIVHDYFGHLKEGYGFRAAGEDNAWRSHASMYSDLARPAMTTETRGQNSWVNFGPHAEANKGASGADTIYADQKVGLMPEWTMRDRDSPAPIIVYHGSPHAFNQFDPSKIGSGEGQQVFGHGLYFAEHSPVSEWYRHQLATRHDPLLKKYGLSQTDGSRLGKDLSDNQGDHQPIVEELQDYINTLKGQKGALVSPSDPATINAQIKKNQAMVRYLNDPKRSKGHLYETAIDRPDEHFLHWDKLLSEQSPYVQERLQPIIEASRNRQMRARAELLQKAQNALANYRQMGLSPSSIKIHEANIARLSQPLPDPANIVGKRLYEMAGMPANTPTEGYPRSAERLRARGIAGIKYLDQGSRTGGRGTHNYVTFDAPRILRRYALPGLLGGGAFGGAALSQGGEDGS